MHTYSGFGSLRRTDGDFDGTIRPSGAQLILLREKKDRLTALHYMVAVLGTDDGILLEKDCNMCRGNEGAGVHSRQVVPSQIQDVQ